MCSLRRSSRLPSSLSPSALQAALDKQTGAPPADLTQSNPTRCGFYYPKIDLPVLGPMTWTYAPEATGMQAARAQLAQYLNARGHALDPQDIVLTASTSEAYSTLLKLLCDPGQCVATGTPGYPLVEHLAELEAVNVQSYRWLQTDSVCSLDWDSVAVVLEKGVCALILVQPNSPTGTCLTPEDLTRLSHLCSKAGAVLIIDAVFEAYTPEAGLTHMPEALQTSGVSIVLGGLSKAAGMPQLKLGWMLLYGDAADKAQLLSGLAWIADAYLSVNTPVQVALPEILPHLEPMQQQIRQRIQKNYVAMHRLLGEVPNLGIKPYHGGWYAVLQGPPDADEAHVVRLLRSEAQVLVHPGYFYDFEQAGLFVVSLIVQHDVFVAACKRVAAVLRLGFCQPHCLL